MTKSSNSRNGNMLLDDNNNSIGIGSGICSSSSNNKNNSSTLSITKENNGRAAQSRRRRIFYQVCIVLIILIITLILFVNSTSNSSSSSSRIIDVAIQHQRMRSKQQQEQQEHDITDILINDNQKQQQRRTTRRKQLQQNQLYRNDKTIRYEKEGDVIPMGIQNGYLHLIDVRIDRTILMSQYNYQNWGLYGTFCRLEWSIHKINPSRYPMFRDIVQYSKEYGICDETTISNVPLQPLVKDLQKIDITINDYEQQQEHNNNIGDIDNIGIGAIVLKTGGFVFHESRCGSTLVANLLSASNPTQHRVYSESSPPIQILSTCGEQYEFCSKNIAGQLFKSIIYLMSRRQQQKQQNQNQQNQLTSSNDKVDVGDEQLQYVEEEQETTVFFKIQSVGSRYISTFHEAFSTTVPWIFVYRHPIHVMMSHLKYGVKHANCYRNSRHPSKSIVQIFEKYNQNNQNNKNGNNNNGNIGSTRPNHRRDSYYTSSIQPEDYCAAHLASITENIVTNYNPNTGIVINYSTLPDMLYTTIFNQHFHILVTSESIDRMKDTATQYSKGRDSKNAGTFHTDNKEKEDTANDKVKHAVALYLQPSYDKLEQLAKITGTTTTTTTI